MQDFRELLPTELKEEILAYRCDYRITVDYEPGDENFEVNLLYPTLVVAFEIRIDFVSEYPQKLRTIHRKRTWNVDTGINSFIERDGDDVVIARDSYVTAIVLYCSDIIKVLKIVANHPLDKDLHIRI